MKIAPLIAILVILITGFVLVNQITPPPPDNPDPITRIEHVEAALGITPQPDGTLCPFLPELLDDFSWEDMLNEPPATSGLGYAMLAEDISGASVIGYNTFQTAPDTAFQGTFHLYYPDTPANSSPVDLRYIVILDEQQIAAFADEPDIYHDIRLQPGEQIALDLFLSPLSPGIHDLIVLGVVETPLNNYGDIVALPYRATLIAGDIRTVPTQAYRLLEPAAYKVGDEGFFNLGLHDDQSQHIWVWPDVYKQVQDTLDFYISAGYTESQAQLGAHGIPPQQSPFAILAFLNSEQIALRPDSNVFYAAVAADNLYSFIPVSIEAVNRHGQSDLLILRVNYPRMPLCWLRGAQGSYQFDSGVYARRVGVEFK